MIEKIEELRKDLGLRKRDLCVAAGVSVTMYSRYLSGTVMGVDVCERMLDSMGFKLEVVLKED